VPESNVPVLVAPPWTMPPDDTTSVAPLATTILLSTVPSTASVPPLWIVRW
jgi:hypothetical protein